MTNENLVLERRNGGGNMVENVRFRRKGLTGMQRGCCCIATEPPLNDDGSPVASQGDPYGRTNPDILASKSGFSGF